MVCQGMEANPFDARFPVRLGMCLDWIGRSQEASPYFDIAERMDPDNYYIALEVGRHFVALGDFAKGKEWVERSLHIMATPDGVLTWRWLMKNLADPLYAPAK